jgi:short-subunit dehydrogenase
MAQNLGRAGYRLFLLARNESQLQQAAAQLQQAGIVVDTYRADVSRESDLSQVAIELQRTVGHIDFLILNAGMVTVKLLRDYSSTDELRQDLDIDLWGTIMSAYSFQPLLREGSKILMISSGFGLMGAAGYSIYCAAKAGVVNFAEALRRELLSQKIQVFVACPGDIDTPQYAFEMQSQPDWMQKETPRKLMKPEEAARIILGACRQEKRFLITNSSDVRLLMLVSKLLPRRWRDWLLDRMFPRP